MQTSFTEAQLADPATRSAADVIRKCVHCGFCTATCPTYVLLGDELDSPRGRIYLMKDMLEREAQPTPEVVKHVDRCLSCLACMTTCPSGVNYMHLVDHARHYIATRFRRPLADRLLRRMLGTVLPRPRLFRAALRSAQLGRLLTPLAPGRLRALLALAPARLPASSPTQRPQVFPAEGSRRRRVALLTGCAQTVLAPSINEATIRLLRRHGCEVVVAKGVGCCGALTHHLGQDGAGYARANIDAWTREIDGDGLDAVVINASGCGTTVKDYGFLFRNDPDYAAKAALISSLTRDITELLAEIGVSAPVRPTGQRVAYHGACSMQHGQRLHEVPKRLLSQAGFSVVDIPEGHLCCGSAGTYNILQPEIASALRARKVSAIESVSPEIVATGNVGCQIQIGGATSLPVVHTAELLDWATGGPKPAALGL